MTMLKKPKTYWRNLEIFTLVTFLIAFAGGFVYLSRSWGTNLVYSSRTQPAHTPADFGIETWEEVWFTSADNLRLSGWFIPPAPEADGAAIIYIHGSGGNRGNYLATAELLVNNGFGAFLIDLRSHGNSEGDFSTFGLLEVQDVQAAVDYLLTRPDVNPERIGLIGHSMGGATVILAAAQIPEIRALVAESAYTSLEDNLNYSLPAFTGLPAIPFTPLVTWFAGQEIRQDLEVRPIDHIASIAPRPVLLVHGEQDVLVLVENAHNLYAAAGEPKFLYIIPNAAHGNFIAAAPGEYEIKLIEFFSEYLLNNL